MNVEVEYKNNSERNNASNRIPGFLSEELNELNTVEKRLTYSK